MSKDKISDYSATANSNTDIGGINIDEGCAPSGINDAIRTLMKQLKDWQSGSQDVYIHPAGSASVPSITATGDTNTGLFFPAADTVGITTGGTERARVDSSGNLGLGVTPSAWTRKAFQLGDAAAAYVANNSGGATVLATNMYFDGSNKYATSAGAARYSVGAGTHEWYNAASGTAGNAISFTQAMTLDASGNLGVGTTSPAGKLDVAGTIAISPGNAQGLIRRTTVNGSYGVQIQGNTNDTRSDTYPGASIGIGGGPVTGDAYAGRIDMVAYGNLTDSTSNIITFQRRTGTNTTAESARIDSSGNLLVGTTTAYAKFVTTQSNGALRTGTLENTASSSFSQEMLLLYYSGGTPNTASANFIRATDATNDKFIVATTGNVTNRNNSYGGISDVKLKENITDATPKLAQLNQIRVVNYNFIGSEEKQLGVVAQEIEAIFPALVTETPDVDNDGNDLGTTTKSVKYSVFVPMLIKAIQEQQAIITQLQADVAALKG